METTNTLLVVIETHDEEMAVLVRAAEMARALDASLELFTCVYDAEIAAERAFETNPDLDKAKRATLETAQGELESLAEPLRKEGLKVAVDACWDKPVFEGIVRKVLRSKPRMVLHNSEYHSAIQRAVLANDDWNLIRTCPVPLLLVRPRPFHHNTLRIWAAIDPLHAHAKPPALDEAICHTAITLSDALRGETSLVHTYDASAAIAAAATGAVTPVVLPADDIAERVRQNHEDAVRELASNYRFADEDIHILAGTPRSILPGLVRNEEVDLLVMGAVARGAFKRVLLGSSAERLVDRLACDLLIVKAPGFETPVEAKSRQEMCLHSAA